MDTSDRRELLQLFVAGEALKQAVHEDLVDGVIDPALQQERICKRAVQGEVGYHASNSAAYWVVAFLFVAALLGTLGPVLLAFL